MNNGCLPPSGNGVFLVRCTDCKCLAVQGADRKWRSFYDDAVLSGVVEPIISIPFELVLPFLPNVKRERLRPVPACANK